MANDLGNSPMRIDTFGADVIIGVGNTFINAMFVTNEDAGVRDLTFIDDDGAVCLFLKIAADATAQLTPSKPMRFSNGITYDDSASDTAAGDFIFVFIE